jgi:hypothetical protein
VKVLANKKLKCKNKKCGRYEYVKKGIQTPRYFFCIEDCREEFTIDEYRKARKKKEAKAKQCIKKEEKAARCKHKADKERIKPKSKWLAEAQAAFNKYIRIRDYWLPCISCGKPREVIEHEQGWKTGGCWDAGHFKTRGAKPQLRFVLFNVHKQCKSCNSGSGKFSSKAATVDAQYRISLIEKIGVDKVEFLENNNDLDLKKNDIEYLKRIKAIFSKRARILERRLKQFN